jgi:hypothetical protein
MRRYAKGKTPGSRKSSSRSIRISWDLSGPIRWVVNRPRSLRIVLVSICALAVTLAIFPVVDELYIRFLFNDATRLLPSFVSTGIGIVMYIWGWRLIIGTIGEEQPVRLAAFWYLVIGILAILLVIGLFLQGYSIGTAPDS